MNASDGVAASATQIAQTDRRALSEAWYSALHLAHAAPIAHSPRGRVAADARPAPIARIVPVQTQAEHVAAPLPARARHGANVRSTALPERRRPVSETA